MNAISARAPYGRDILDALFEAVEMDDVVDPVVVLPDQIPVDCDCEAMRACLDLCVQFWREGADIVQLRALTMHLLVHGDLSPEERQRFKHIRACYKQMRFALTLYGARHRPPWLFHRTVVKMGQLQDAFRTQRRLAVIRRSLELRLLLGWPFWRIVLRQVETVRLDGAEGFRRYRDSEIARLKTWLDDARLTAHRFHAMRKIVSRLVSFYDTFRVLAPDEHAFRMSRFLSAINGLMGSMHDELIEGAATGTHNYHRDALALPADIYDRLRLLTERYPKRQP